MRLLTLLTFIAGLLAMTPSDVAAQCQYVTNTQSCDSGSGNGSVIVTAFGGSSFYNISLGGFTPQSTTNNTATFTGLPAGTYQITVVGASPICSTGGSYTVAVCANNEITDTGFPECGEFPGDQIITGTTISGVTYQWQVFGSCVQDFTGGSSQWFDIPGATQRDYTPPREFCTLRYRRRTLVSNSVTSTSNEVIREPDPIPAGVFTVTNQTCTGTSGTGQVVLNYADQSDNHQVAWYFTGNSSPFLSATNAYSTSGLPPNDYTLIVTNQRTGCSRTFTATVSAASIIDDGGSIDNSATTRTYCDVPSVNPQIFATAASCSDGSTPTYSWFYKNTYINNRSGAIAIPGSNVEDLSHNVAQPAPQVRSYWRDATCGCGQTETLFTTITVSDMDVNVTAANGSGDDIVLTANQTGALTFAAALRWQWFRDGSAVTGSIAGSAGATYTVAGGTAGTYCVELDDNTSCPVEEACYTIVPSANADDGGTITNNPNPYYKCVSGTLGLPTITATAGGCDGPGTPTYRWFRRLNGTNLSPVSSLSEVGSGPSLSGQSIAPNNYATYFRLTQCAGDSGDSGEWSDGYTVYPYNATTSVSAIQDDVCDPDGTITATAIVDNYPSYIDAGQFSYNWALNGTPTGGNTPTITRPIQNDNIYSVTVTGPGTPGNACQGGGSTNASTILREPLTADLFVASAAACGTGGSLNVTNVSGWPAGDITYSWYRAPGTFLPGPSGFGITNQSAGDLSAGEYYVVLSYNDGQGNTCTFTTDDAVIDDVTVMVTGGNFQSPASDQWLCSTPSTNPSLSATAGSCSDDSTPTYRWFYRNNSVSRSGATEIANSNSPNLTHNLSLSAGNYRKYWRDVECSCGATTVTEETGDGQVVYVSNLAVTITPQDVPNSSSVLLTTSISGELTPFSPVTYAWTRNGGATIGTSSSYTVSPGTTGMFCVFVTDDSCPELPRRGGMFHHRLLCHQPPGIPHQLSRRQ